MQVKFTDRIGIHYKCVPIKTALKYLEQDTTYRKDIFLALEGGKEIISDNLGNNYPARRVDRGQTYSDLIDHPIYGCKASFAFIPEKEVL